MILIFILIKLLSLIQRLSIIFGLKQFIDFPTHSFGHTLDLLCCTGITPFDCSSRDLSISDHKLVSFSAKLTVSKIAVLSRFAILRILNYLCFLMKLITSLMDYFAWMS